MQFGEALFLDVRAGNSLVKGHSWQKSVYSSYRDGRWGDQWGREHWTITFQITSCFSTADTSNFSLLHLSYAVKQNHCSGIQGRVREGKKIELDMNPVPGFGFEVSFWWESRPELWSYSLYTKLKHREICLCLLFPRYNLLWYFSNKCAIGINLNIYFTWVQVKHACALWGQIILTYHFWKLTFSKCPYKKASNKPSHRPVKSKLKKFAVTVASPWLQTFSILILQALVMAHLMRSYKVILKMSTSNQKMVS